MDQMLTANRFATDFLEVLRAERVIAILRSRDAKEAVSTGKELIGAGIRVLEVSLTTPGALEAIAELSASTDRSHVLVGAGTVLDAASVAKAGEAGARFYVSPVLEERAIAAANELGMASVPGCATPTEMLAAHAAGAAAIKVFPATLWNPDGLANVLRAMPFLPLVPTGGIGVENAAAWLAAGSTALGIGSSLTAAEGNVADLRRAISPYTTGRNS
jgi:2-dehydro-3-deoxyphosphogluconate aldolase / (4S)-4-hydroxy-2-oxoglutarate aldolase